MIEVLEKKNHYNMLYPYYQALLTPKQCLIFENYYFEDYSLTEIATNLNVSRNAIWDVLKHVEHNLDEYENKLELYKKSLEKIAILEELFNHTDPQGQMLIEKLKGME